MWNTSVPGAPGQALYGVCGADSPCQRDIFGEMAAAAKKIGLGVTLPSAYPAPSAPLPSCTLLLPSHSDQCGHRKGGGGHSSLYGCAQIDRTAAPMIIGHQVGAYYSKADWHAGSYWRAPQTDGSDNFPQNTGVNYNFSDGEGEGLLQVFNAFNKAQLSEIVTKYKPDLIWCVVRDINLGHQPLLPPANWCPIFASRTTQARRTLAGDKVQLNGG